MIFFFTATSASRGHHVYKETSCSNAKMKKEVRVELGRAAKSILTDPYAYAIKAKHSNFIEWKTVFHVKSIVN